ncbi:hypothetical protein DFJ74DRAFT_434750 [Hyaloraphidium curvatum]|nr:hypothetical protein DFJ74DRAFT_434750 [Hyaloraphidium curvatum]
MKVGALPSRPSGRSGWGPSSCVGSSATSTSRLADSVTVLEFADSAPEGYRKMHEHMLAGRCLASACGLAPSTYTFLSNPLASQGMSSPNRRVSCLACAKVHLKCDRAPGVCGRCAFRADHCVYPSNSAPQPGGHPRLPSADGSQPALKDLQTPSPAVGLLACCPLGNGGPSSSRDHTPTAAPASPPLLGASPPAIYSLPFTGQALPVSPSSFSLLAPDGVPKVSVVAHDSSRHSLCSGSTAPTPNTPASPATSSLPPNMPGPCTTPPGPSGSPDRMSLAFLLSYD